LRAINGFAQILEEELAPTLNQEHARHLSRLRGAANTMGHLIEDMLTLSRVTRIQRREVTFRPDDLIREVIESLENEMPQRIVNFVVGDMEPCTTDRRLLRQVFANLLSNSIKFTRNTTDSIIEVNCTIINGERIWVVRDNGIGFDPTYAERIFRPFERLHSQSAYEGTGIGLAIVQRIVQRLRGRLWVESEPGNGASFYFTITEGLGEIHANVEPSK
jgi:signal transduction histidine kinase